MQRYLFELLYESEKPMTFAAVRRAAAEEDFVFRLTVERSLRRNFVTKWVVLVAIAPDNLLLAGATLKLCASSSSRSNRRMLRQCDDAWPAMPVAAWLQSN